MNDNCLITDDHIQALEVVRTILGTTINPERIGLCNTKHYDTIILDGNNWKTICRLYFKENKTIGILNTRRVETKTRISIKKFRLWYFH